MAITLVQNATPVTTSNSIAANVCSFTSLPTTGNAVIVVVKTFNTSGGNHSRPSAMVDNQSGNTFVKIKDNNVSVNGNISAALWWCPSITAPSGTYTVTATLDNTGTTWLSQVELYEWSGLAGTIDQSASVPDTGTGVETATLTNAGANANANDLVMTVILCGNSNGAGLPGAPTTGYTSLQNTDTGGITRNSNTSYKIVSAIETSSAVYTWSGAGGSNSSFAALIATFPATASAPVPFTPFTKTQFFVTETIVQM
jgi:hypothetical protein